MTTLQLHIEHDKRPFCGMDVLFYYDGPLLFWLPCEGRRLLAVSLPDEAGHWPFLVVELTEAQALDVEGSRTTLRAACLAASAKWLMRNYDAIPLELEPLEGLIPEEWLPGDVVLRADGGAQ